VPDEGDAGGGPGLGIRLFVGGFLGLFLLTGLIGVEAWPLTGWSLYSRLRHGEQWGWQVLAVGPDGGERAVDLQRLPAAYHGVTYFLGGFAGRPPAEQRSACLALGGAARMQYPDTLEVAVDRVRYRIRTDPDRPPGAPTGRVRSYRCRLG
jgi:hypothetical protein